MDRHDISLQTVDTGITDSAFEDASNELYRYEQALSERKCIWGYFPGFKNDANEYPACKHLDRQMRDFLSEKVFPDENIFLSFIKLASTKPKQEFGGLHLDDKLGSSIETHGRDIMRILVNIHDHPRYLRYCPLTGEDLIKRGVAVTLGEYHPISLPKEIGTKSIAVPPRRHGNISILSFLATQIPHVGVTEKNGYFLMGYGYYC